MSPARRSATVRPTSWWLETLRRRAERMHEEALDLSQPITWRDAEEHRAAIKFFNAAFRAEESGLRQAHELSQDVASWDPSWPRSCASTATRKAGIGSS